MVLTLLLTDAKRCKRHRDSQTLVQQASVRWLWRQGASPILYTMVDRSTPLHDGCAGHPPCMMVVRSIPPPLHDGCAGHPSAPA